MGGNFYVQQTGRNEFQLTLVFFRDFYPGAAPVADPTVRVFNLSDTSAVTDIVMTQKTVTYPEIGDECFSPSQISVEQHTFTRTITLSDNPAGYLLVLQQCCRNPNISNISNPGITAMTWTAIIPDPALPGGNSSPDLGGYPRQGYFCVNQERNLDLSAYDKDGDSLHYEMVIPKSTQDGNSVSTVTNPYPPPYPLVSWALGYSFNDILGTGSTLTIDGSTGVLSSRPLSIGVYAFAYRVSEFRNGVKIGEVIRDVQFEAVDCINNWEPVITQPTDNKLTLDADERLCKNIVVVDSNTTDSVYLSVTYKSTTTSIVTTLPEFSTDISGIGEVSGTFCWEPNCFDAFKKSSFILTISGRSYSCNDADTVYKEVLLEVSPEEPNVEDLVPNVFTPNNDGINDYFTLGIGADKLPCMESLYFQVYNRWGVLVYETSDTNFKWDGTFKGKPLQQGVYFYVLRGQYSDYTFEIKDFLSLM